MAKVRSVWRCQTCGAGASRWQGRCSDCGEFGTMVEEIEQPVGDSRRAARASVTPLGLDTVGASEAARVSTGIDELDRVLGGVRGRAPVGDETLLRRGRLRVEGDQRDRHGGRAHSDGKDSVSHGR